MPSEQSFTNVHTSCAMWPARALALITVCGASAGEEHAGRLRPGQREREGGGDQVHAEQHRRGAAPCKAPRVRFCLWQASSPSTFKRRTRALTTPPDAPSALLSHRVQNCIGNRSLSRACDATATISGVPIAHLAPIECNNAATHGCCEECRTSGRCRQPGHGSGDCLSSSRQLVAMVMRTPLRLWLIAPLHTLSDQAS